MYTLAYVREPIYKHIHMYTCHTRTHIRTCTHIHMHRNIYTNTCNGQANPNAKGGLWQCTGHSREFASIVPLYKLYALPPMRPGNCAKFPLTHGDIKDIFRRRYWWGKVCSLSVCVSAMCVPVNLCACASARRLLYVVQERGPVYQELCEWSTEWVVFSVLGASNSRYHIELKSLVECVVLCLQCSIQALVHPHTYTHSYICIST